MSEWIKCSDNSAPKEGKFLFNYYYGTGLGEWGQCYTIINGNSERTHEAYILVLWPSEILDGSNPIIFSEEIMKDMKMSWMPLPQPPKDEE